MAPVGQSLLPLATGVKIRQHSCKPADCRTRSTSKLTDVSSGERNRVSFVRTLHPLKVLNDEAANEVQSDLAAVVRSRWPDDFASYLKLPS